MGALPKLLYLGNPPVLDTTGGSGLLYRLFRGYPADRVAMVWAAGGSAPRPEQLLPGVRHELIALPDWLTKSRSHRLDTVFTMSYSFASTWWARRVRQSLGDFTPDAVVSVTHGLLWDTAVDLADRLGVPCHLIHHDHWSGTVPVPARFRKWAGERWARACRRAQSNLCVSQGMLEEVRATGATRASILLPTSSPGSFAGEPAGLRPSDGKLVFGYAGTVQTPGHLDMFRRFAGIAVARGHTLRIFSPHPEQFWRDGLGGLYRDGMWGGSLPGEKVPAALREQTDALFLPLSFEARDQDNMRVSFPCKVCDYCASGRPVVAWLPPYASAAHWMAGQDGTFLLNTALDEAPMADFIQRLEAPATRLALGEATFWVGRAAFSAEAAAEAFRAALQRT